MLLSHITAIHAALSRATNKEISMKARMHFKDVRGNHRILDGFYDELKSVISPDWSRKTTAKECQRAAFQSILQETGIAAMNPILVCVDGGKK